MVAPPNPEKVALLGNEGAAPARATGGWARVLAGAATLGTMAVAATLATHPGLASTLGAGLALPPVPSTGDLSATSVRPVAGMGSGPARTQEVEVSTADPVVAVASLGRSPHRAAPSHREIAVEPHRDRQYLVPDIVISELSAKLGKNRGERTRRDRHGSAVMKGSIEKKGSRHRDDVLHTPVYVVSMEESTKDALRVAELLGKLVSFHGSDAVKRHVHLTPGINIAAWPKKIDLAEYALKSVLAVKSKSQVGSLPWLETYTNRDKKGHVTPRAKEFPLSHHIGCLFAHLYDWQMSSDAGYKNTILFESDAVDPSLLGVELSAIQTVVNHAPKDFDLIFLTKRSEKGGKLAKKFKDPLGNELKLYHLDEPNEEAGLSSYIISDTFFKKMRRYIVEHGADMVDAWLSSKLCVKPAFDKHGKFVAWEERAGGEYRYLSCYHVQQDGFRSTVSDEFPKAS